MKIICVSGGNYKSFYINCATKQYQCDLLVFNSDIIYDYVVKDELLGDAIVTKELTALSKKMGCVVVAKVNVVLNKIVTKSLIVCDGEKLSVGPSKLGQKICVKEKTFVVGDQNLKSTGCNKIVLSDKKIYPNLQSCASKRTYIFCDKKGTTVVVGKKMSRKFYKYSKIILK